MGHNKHNIPHEVDKDASAGNQSPVGTAPHDVNRVKHGESDDNKAKGTTAHLRDNKTVDR